MKAKMQINPLSFIAADFSGPDGKPTLEEVLAFLCPPGTPSDTESLVKRYREAGQVGPRLALLPNEQKGLERIVWPLRQARASYMTGNYLSVIALCGMVSEMVALFLWELEDVKLDEKAEFGCVFEKCGQKDRTQILTDYNIITEENKRSFDEVREIRRKYLHFWSQDHGRLSTDASKVFGEAVTLVEISVGVEGFQDGMARLPERLVEYLKRHGLVD